MIGPKLRLTARMLASGSKMPDSIEAWRKAFHEHHGVEPSVTTFNRWLKALGITPVRIVILDGLFIADEPDHIPAPPTSPRPMDGLDEALAGGGIKDDAAPPLGAPVRFDNEDAAPPVQAPPGFGFNPFGGDPLS